MITQQVDSKYQGTYSINEEGKGVIKVLSKDTDVFVLLCSHFFERKWSSQIYVDQFTNKNKMVSIKKSVHSNEKIVPSLIALQSQCFLALIKQKHKIS